MRQPVNGPADLAMHERLARERDFYDELVIEGSPTRNLLDRLSSGFYDKSPEGPIWAPIWKSINLQGARVLDYGCGNGHFSQLLGRFGAEVCGVDISPQLIAQACAANPARGNGFPQFFVCDAHDTKFPDGCFDYVFGNGVIHHLDADGAYAEIARVLRPGGKAFFMEPMFHHPLVWLLRRLTPKLRSPDERPLSISDLERAKKSFRAVRHREHFLLAVGAAPAHLLGRRAALAAIGAADRVDQWLMRLAPPLSRFAWLTMLELEK